ncbi:MAG: hypothetical protein M3384_21270 [Acidobacteriota bacterium]|nr:hypothetical protein [Acidobacteriota bacterium]
MNDRIKRVLDKYPTLEFNEQTQRFTGFLFASESDGDRYFVEIDITPFPKFFPQVWETGERIPRENDRHCFTEDGSLCFTTRPKEELLLQTKILSLTGFIEHILIPYLQNNSHFEMHGEYKFGEHSHSSQTSNYETYKELLDIDNPLLIEKVLESLVKGIKIKPNERCYCGSNLKIKRCGNHNLLYKNVRRISNKTLSKGKNRISDYVSELEKNKNNSNN